MKKIILSTSLIFTIFVILLFTNACTSDMPIPEETPQTNYAIDNLPGSNDLQYELDEEILTELVNLIRAGNFGKIHSLIIIHNDSLAMEEYFLGWTRHMLHPVYSIAKSITSALIGIAIDQDKISSVDENLLSFFTEYDDIVNLDEHKETITLENLLTMTAGFIWNDSTHLGGLMQSDDWIKHMLDLPMSDDPGKKRCTTLVQQYYSPE